MPKYNESTAQGETWRRAFQVICSNDYGKNPTIDFNEEDIIILPENKFLKSFSGKVGEVFTEQNANTSFQLRNPLTEEYIEQYATYQDIFVLMHSLYFHLAKERDKGPKPYPSWIWNNTINEWEAPVPKPEDGKQYDWNEETQTWAEVVG